MATAQVDVVEMLDYNPENPLPATEEARLALIAALQRYAAELGTEIRTRWN